MSRIALATESADLRQRVQHASGEAVLALTTGALRTEPAHLFGPPDAAAPEVLVLDAGPGADEALALAARVEAGYPGTAVVLVSDRPAEIGLAALRSGVHDILEPGADVADIRSVLDRAARASRARAAAATGRHDDDAAAARGRVISVVSPKGGVGKTTVATNLAVGLARAEPDSTVLVDLDIQFGDVASALNLRAEYSLADAVHGPASRDTMVLKTFLTVHETGLYVLCGSDSPAAADAVTAEDVGRLLAMLASEFRHVVVDTAPGLSEHTLAAMDETSDLVLVTSMDVPGVRGMRKELDTLDALGMFPDARYVALNFADRRGGLSVADVEATLGTGVDLVLPRSRAALASVNAGVPLLQSEVRDPVTKHLRTLVRRYTTPEAAAVRTTVPAAVSTTGAREVAGQGAAASGRRKARHRGGRR
ncbi:AAA family ATPase [Georgenia subflava]|uniref:AAA family ATPase n=1 Tax=Georgenia subflava TaxID=1622177 RepID=A0A6N7EJ14_9MICO|nr:AAA family ATPase [Georgenia subflava]MPV37018.1 AAA family ATPase [Georgenia subflava]